MSVVIPDEVVRATGFPEDEVVCEFAVWLFQQDRISLGKAAELADMDRLTFQRLLGSRNIPLHYDIEDFEQDLKTLRELEQ